MLERMVNPVIVSKVSGIKIASLVDTYLNESINLVCYETLNQAINGEIVKTNITVLYKHGGQIQVPQLIKSPETH